MSDENPDAGSTATVFSVAIAIVVVLAGLGSLGYMATSAEYQERIEQQVNYAKAYCDQVHDDPAVYNAMVSGQHGGLHCVENDGSPHLHAIPQEYQREAYQAQQNGEDLGWTVETAEKHADPAPWYQSMVGLVIVAAIPAVVIGGVVGVYSRVSSGDDSA